MQFASDCKQVVENCRLYYDAGNEEGTSICEQANRLLACMMKHLTPLLDAEKKNPSSITTTSLPLMTIKKPKKEFLQEVLCELRATMYTDKVTKFTEKATIYFETPVDTTVVTDYREFVETPMDLETVDHKIESGACECSNAMPSSACDLYFNLSALLASRLRRCHTGRLRI